MEYTIKDNRVILINTNTDIQVLWFKDLKSFTISSTTLYFSMIFGDFAVNVSDITIYNGWGACPPIANIYNDTKNAINAFEGNTVISGTILSQTSPYRVISNRNPLPSDDISFGYVVTVQWLNTISKDLFECVDNTLGSAIWKWISYVNL